MAVTFEGVYVRDHRVPQALERLRQALSAVGAQELQDAGQPSPQTMRRASLALQETGGITEIVGFPPGAGEPFARELSREGQIALAAGVEEGEVWFYGMYRDGELVDRYVSLSEYLDEEDAQGAPTGDPEKAAAAWQVDEVRLREVVREPAAHAEAALSDFLEALGIPGALEPLPPEALRIELLVPEVEVPPGMEDEGSPAEEEEAVREMLGALGLDEARAAQYMDVMRSLEKVAGEKGLLEADPADAERLLMESPELRGMAGKVSAMRRELMEAFEKTVEAAGTKDPALRGVLSRADRAARLETELADNMRRFKAQPKEAIRSNAQLLRTLLESALSVEIGRDADAARELDGHLARFRKAEPALSRDLSRALPLLATHFVTDALLAGSSLDLVRQPTSGAIRLRRGSSDADPAAWVAAALARRATVPLRQSIDTFLDT